jgi:N-ethylmaleimide reductase
MINTAYDRAKGNQIVKDKFADPVAYGKPFISNPDMVERFAVKGELTPWDEDVLYAVGAKIFFLYF